MIDTYLKDGAFTAVKRDVKIKVLNKVCERGTFNLPKKWYIKLGKLSDRGAEPSHIKLC